MEWRHTVWPEIRMAYTATPKVANTSVKAALLESFRPDASRRNPHNEQLPYVQVHPDAIAWRHPELLHFAVVRDPFDRFVSFFEDRVTGTGFGERMRRLGFDPGMTFAEAARQARTVSDRRADPHMRSQSVLLAGRGGRLRPHLLLRFERLTQDWNLLSVIAQETTGQKPAPLPHRRVSERQPCASYYDDETRGLVAERYRSDFALLGYPTRPGTPVGDRDDDGIVPQLEPALRAGARAVLDLTRASASRAAAVEAVGGYYLAIADASRVGQLTDARVLQDGRLPDSLFDVLVVHTRQVGLLGAYRWLWARFASTGRMVLAV